MSSMRILVRDVAWPEPRRGSRLTWATNSVMVNACRPPPRRRVAPGGSHQLVAYHQQPVVVAGHVALHQDVVAKLGGNGVGPAQMFFRRDVDGDTLALVAVRGLTTTGSPISWAAAQASSRVSNGAAPWAPVPRLRPAASW